MSPCVCVTSTLIIHLKVFILVNINNKPEADVKNHLNKPREMQHEGVYQFIIRKKKEEEENSLVLLGNNASKLKVIVI